MPAATIANLKLCQNLVLSDLKDGFCASSFYLDDGVVSVNYSIALECFLSLVWGCVCLYVSLFYLDDGVVTLLLVWSPELEE